MKKSTFYILSLTWGCILTLVGLIVAAVLVCLGFKPKKYGWCYYFQVGKHWGGLNLGIICLTSHKPTTRTKNHEHGHAIQNCLFGPLMPFIVCIPSAIRYWYRTLYYHRKGEYPPTEYDDIWFEGQATRIGTLVVERLNKERNNER